MFPKDVSIRCFHKMLLLQNSTWSPLQLQISFIAGSARSIIGQCFHKTKGRAPILSPQDKKFTDCFSYHNLCHCFSSTFQTSLQAPDFKTKIEILYETEKNLRTDSTEDQITQEQMDRRIEEEKIGLRKMIFLFGSYLKNSHQVSNLLPLKVLV